MWIVESSSSSSSNVSMWRWRRCFATISAFNVVNVNCLPTIIAIFSTSYTSQFIFSNFFFICKLPECTRYHFLYVWIPHTPSSDKRRRQFSNGIYKCDFFVSYFHLLLVAPFSSVSNECLWLLCSVVIVCDKQFSVCGVTLNTIYWPIKQYYWQYTHTYKLSVSETVSVIIVDFVNQSLLNYGVTTDKQRQNRNDKWMYDNDNDANFGWLYGIDFFSTWTEWRQIWSPKCTYNECCHIARSYISCVYLCAPSDVKYNYWVIAPVITYHCQWRHFWSTLHRFFYTCRSFRANEKQKSHERTCDWFAHKASHVCFNFVHDLFVVCVHTVTQLQMCHGWRPSSSMQINLVHMNK